jgi:hypothetical protein
MVYVEIPRDVNGAGCSSALRDGREEYISQDKLNDLTENPKISVS